MNPNTNNMVAVETNTTGISQRLVEYITLKQESVINVIILAIVIK